ncbi:glycosyltransferase family 2 protein [bacterium]|nr:MAG: glycosyltransferase family 2 protein [bacterium]
MKFHDSWEIPQYDVQEFKPKATKYAVCVFLINEGDKIKKQLTKMATQADLADIIIADGGSTDGSLSEELLQQSGVTALLTKREPGKLGTQMRMAFAYCLQQGYEGVIVVDGNNKDDTTAIPLFIQALDDGFDHIQGSRFVPGGQAINTPIERLVGVHLLHAPVVSLSAGRRYTDTTNGFRAYSKKLLTHEQMAVFRKVFTGYELHYYLAIRSANLGLKSKEVPVKRQYPKNSPTPTKISPVKGNLGVLKVLFKAALHRYDPKSK